MTPPRSIPFRVARAIAVTLVVLAALYLIAGNVLLKTQLLRHLTNEHPEQLMLDYDEAYTLFPGWATVRGLRLRFEDGNIRFQTTLDEAKVKIALFELARMRFHATQVRAKAISWQMLHKVEKVEGNEERIAAFPKIEGFPEPPIKAPPPEGPPSNGDGTWSVQLDDVEGDVRELWMLEYRYVGVGHVVGSFELRPMKSVWVGPATLVLEDGMLSAGKRMISKNFAMNATCLITPFNIVEATGLQPLASLTATVKISAQLADLSMVGLYTDEVTVSGTGMLTADLRLEKGVVSKGSVADVQLNALKATAGRAGFEGAATASFRLAPDSKDELVPIGRADITGSVVVPVSKDAVITAKLSELSGDLSLTTANLVGDLGLQWLHAKLGEARAEDARPIVNIAAEKVPVIARAALGSGPLITGGTADVTPGKIVLDIKKATLGNAGLVGALQQKPGAKWNGAAAGHVAAIQIGVRVKAGTLEAEPLIKEGWLETELAKLGIEPPLTKH